MYAIVANGSEGSVFISFAFVMGSFIYGWSWCCLVLLLFPVRHFWASVEASPVRRVSFQVQMMEPLGAENNGNVLSWFRLVFQCVEGHIMTELAGRNILVEQAPLRRCMLARGYA